MPQKLITGRLSTPGTWGLNSQRKADILPSGWATVASNCVFDDSGRLAAREGYQHINATAITGDAEVRTVHEYTDGSGVTITICAANNKIYKRSGDTLVDISGTITTPTDDHWKFQNFNGHCVGAQAGHNMIRLTSAAGSFADITTTGTQQPTNAVNEILAAFGRIWALDGNDLKYCDSLDETAWNNLFDLSTVWLAGDDDGVALTEFNGHLVVFGENSIVVYNNPWSPTGTGTLDTSLMSLVENIGNIGCVARDSVQFIGTDVVFLSHQGVRSLGRTIQEKSMPVQDISSHVNDDFLRNVVGETPTLIKSAYSKAKGFYLLSLPTIGTVYYFDLRYPLQDRSFRVTTWDVSLTALEVDPDDTLWIGTPGWLSTYTGYLDDKLSDGTGGDSYQMEYVSGWNDLSEIDPSLSPLEKLPKTGNFLILGGGGQTAVIKWAFDFEDTFYSFQRDIPTSGVAEWGIAQYNIDEYSGGLVFNRIRAPLRKTGQVIKLGFQIIVNGSTVALQSMDLNMKLGRIAS